MRFRKHSPKRKSNSDALRLETSGSSDTGIESIQFTPMQHAGKCHSLGTGQVLPNGRVSFHAASPKSICSSTDSLSSTERIDNRRDRGIKPKKSLSAKKLCKMISTDKLLSPVRDTLSSTASQLSDKLLRPVKFECIQSCYLRVADLQMSETSHSAVSEHDEEHVVPHFHHASAQPPPGVDHDPKEMWVAIDTGEGSHAPIAPFALQALASFGKESAMDETMWTADKKTEKLILANIFNEWHSSVWNDDGPVVLPPRGFPGEDEVLVWTGGFHHGLFGSDIPCVRAAGIIHMNARSLTELLLDSSRVKEYNAMSLGRTDLMVMPGSFEEEGPFGKSVTKVMKSESKPPMLRKVLQFVSIVHAKELVDGSGYLIVTRAVTKADHGVLDASILRSEILMGVNVIRKVEGDENRCIMINVNHIRSPMVPIMIAKRIGLSAAANFFHDLRALC